jgi:hypothetical protein
MRIAWSLALGVSLAGCRPDDGEPGYGPIHQISYEAIPTPLYELGVIDLTLDNATYEQREAFTVEIRDAVLPNVVALTDLSMLDTELTPGGFQLVTNPSLQSRVEAASADIELLAAAIGYTFSQWSVLVTDFSETDGETRYGVVALDVDVVDPKLGQDFFTHAASVAGGLGGGYFAFDNELIFLNIRGSDGAPYSGLDDDAFVAKLRDAARTFAPMSAELVQSGNAAVIFVENDWATAPVGEDYVAVLAPLGDAALAELDDLRADHTARFEAAAMKYGWN